MTNGLAPPGAALRGRVWQLFKRPVEIVPLGPGEKPPAHDPGVPSGPKRGPRGTVRYYPNDNLHPMLYSVGLELLRRWRREIKPDPESRAQRISERFGIPPDAALCALDPYDGGNQDSGRGVYRLLQLLRPRLAVSQRTVRTLLRAYRGWHGMTCCKRDWRHRLVEDAVYHLQLLRQQPEIVLLALAREYGQRIFRATVTSESHPRD